MDNASSYFSDLNIFHVEDFAIVNEFYDDIISFLNSVIFFFISSKWMKSIKIKRQIIIINKVIIYYIINMLFIYKSIIIESFMKLNLIKFDKMYRFLYTIFLN